MADNRPVNLDPGSIQFPLPALASITHRIPGVILFGAVAVLLWMLDTSLSSEAGFQSLQECLTSGVAKVVVWLMLVALIYHSCAGIKHLVMDAGIGETLEGGVMGAKIVIGSSVVLSILAGCWIW